MNKPAIVVVTGPPGVGKTTWIQQQLARVRASVLYFNPGTGTVPIDQTYIATAFPGVQILQGETESQFLQLLAKIPEQAVAYIELGFHLDLAAIEPVLAQFSCHWVAVMPQNTQKTGWHAWADEVVPGARFEKVVIHPQICRLLLTGEILDLASLEVFWYELTQEAYGQVTRAKGIFDLADGQSVYGDFVLNVLARDFAPLNLPRWLEGRPQRFSGMEVVGKNLDEEAIAQTLKDCCLSEAAIRYYQQQVIESLKFSEAETL